MIAGAQKAGTSSLARYVGQHPQICTHLHREMTFFVNDKEFLAGYEDEYQVYFSHCIEHSGILLAKSAGLMYMESAITRLYDHNPKVKVVMVLRHPVERAYSAYWFARRRGWETLDTFEEALSAEGVRTQADWVHERATAYRDRGSYIRFLPRVYQTFGSENVRTFLLEDLRNNSAGVCAEIFSWLQVTNTFCPDTSRQHNRRAAARSESLARMLGTSSAYKRIAKRLLPRGVATRVKRALLTANERDTVMPPMNPNTRSELVAYFEPLNAQLEDFLGRDLGHWDR